MSRTGNFKLMKWLATKKVIALGFYNCSTVSYRSAKIDLSPEPDQNSISEYRFVIFKMYCLSK